MKLERIEQEETQIIKRELSFRAEMNELELGFIPPHGMANAQVWIAGVGESRVRIPLVKIYPRSVAELELLIERLPDALREFVAAIRAEGYDDLRQPIEIELEKLDKLRNSNYSDE